MSRITTHVLDTVLGKPAAGIAVRLERQENETWKAIGSAETDRDGRCMDLAPDATPGSYRITFATGAYFAQHSASEIDAQLGPLAPEFVKLLPELSLLLPQIQPSAPLEWCSAIQ